MPSTAPLAPTAETAGATAAAAGGETRDAASDTATRREESPFAPIEPAGNAPSVPADAPALTSHQLAVAASRLGTLPPMPERPDSSMESEKIRALEQQVHAVGSGVLADGTMPLLVVRGGGLCARACRPACLPAQTFDSLPASWPCM